MKMTGSYKSRTTGPCQSKPVCDMKMKGSYKHTWSLSFCVLPVCDMKINGRYKVEYKAYFVCDMEVEKY